MKYFTRTIILVFIFCLTSLTSCRTMRTSEKVVSESETASVTASRLTFYRTLDSLSRQFNLSADSIIMIFPNDSEPEFPSEFPSGMEGRLETPTLTPSQNPNARKHIRNASRSASASRPSQVPSYLLRPPSQVAFKIYGLHIADNSEEKSVASANLKDSVVVATQSHKLKSATKQSSHPCSAPTNLVVLSSILALIIIISYVMKKRFH